MAQIVFNYQGTIDGLIKSQGMGSEKRLDYTVIGANVNPAQRLESNAPVGGILVSESVKIAIDNDLKARPFGKVQMKGYEKKPRPLRS